MNNFIEFLNQIWSYISSTEVTGVISFGSIATFIIQAFLSKWQTKKANAKYGAKEAELAALKEAYNKYVTNAELTVKELGAKYVEATKVIQEIHQNMLNQNEALKTAFDNSNINASAKKIVQEYLKPIKTNVGEDEISKVDTLPISNAVTEEQAEQAEKEEVQNEGKIYRVK